MKQFSEMNEAEQKAVLLEKAKRVRERWWGIEGAQIEWLTYTHNAVFLVHHENKKYIMKMAVQDRLLSPNNVMREALISIMLNRHQSHLQVPQKVRATFKNSENPYIGSYLLDGDKHPSDRGPDVIVESVWFNIALYHYAEGNSRNPENVTIIEIQKIGTFLASLHNASNKSIRGLFGLADLNFQGIFSDSGIYPLSETTKALFTLEQMNVMDTVALTVKSAMDELGQGDHEFGLIHGDLLLKNILFHEGEVRALDFEYCGWGYYLYDLCPLLWQLKPLSNYKELEEALWQGYSSIRPLTERHRQLLETFIAGRQVASMRWVAANQHNPAYQGKVASILQQRTAELQGFLETGILKRS